MAGGEGVLLLRMARRNRVTPRSELIANPARGLVYGNCGCLHDEEGRIRRRWSTGRWIACRLEFRGWHREPLMQPGKFTELFFLDEATAFAAGHRPCALCRREDYVRSGELWGEVHPRCGRGRRDRRAAPYRASGRPHPAAPRSCNRGPTRRRVRARRARTVARPRRGVAALDAGRLRGPQAAAGARPRHHTGVAGRGASGWMGRSRATPPPIHYAAVVTRRSRCCPQAARAAGGAPRSRSDGSARACSRARGRSARG